ncbi:hypothetical protein F2Q69_00055490 [Brassica cretica]|uniref:Uncharacterized protein n=1 Tax=Brassica cretica TaxID=69181 RepID=A0A8S9MSV7_BRACR|nr:hypothetical protein F2Q69_00055490 [Brassica cretica]
MLIRRSNCGPNIEEPSAINYFDAGEASGRWLRDLCQDFCSASRSSTASARSTIFCSVSFLLCDSLGDKSQPRPSHAVRRRDLCFRFGVCVTRPVTLWGTPHRSAVPVNINHSDSLSHHVCYSGPMTVKYSTRVVATPQIPRSMSSRLDLPSASPTRSTAASAIPVTHASSSRYSCSENLHWMPLLRPSQSLPSSIVSGILKSCVVGIPPFTRLSGLESRCLLKFERSPVRYHLIHLESIPVWQSPLGFREDLLGFNRLLR